MEFSRQEYWRGLPFPSSGGLPDPGIKPTSTPAGGFLITKSQGKPLLQTPAEAYLVLTRLVGTSPGLAHPQWCKHHEEKNHYLLYFLFISMKRKKESEVAQSCPTLCDSMDCSIPSSSVHGSFQARVLKWVAISFSKGSSWPRDQTQVSWSVTRFFTI